ncbi:MAG: secretin N-terminal domain-containing protein [Elusimicrobiales bacterium]
MTKLALFLACWLPSVAAAQTPPAAKHVIEDALVAQDEVFVKVRAPVRYKTAVMPKTARFVVDLMDTSYPAGSKLLEGQGGLIKRARISQYERKTRFVARLVVELAKAPGKDEWLIIAKPDGLRVMFGAKDALAAARAADADTAKPEIIQAAAPPAPAAQLQPEAAAPAKTAGDRPEPPAKAVAKPEAKPARTETQPDEEAAARQRARPPSDTRFAVKHVTLNLRGMPLTVILEAISKQTGASFIISKDLQNKQFTAVMENVSLRDALRALLEVHGMGYEQIGNSSTYAIKELSHTKMRLATRVFKLKYTQLMDIKARGIGDVTLGAMTSGNVSNAAGAAAAQADAGGKGKIDETTNNFLAVIKGIISEYGALRVYPETNSLIISDVPENMPAIEELIETLDTPPPQVLIEASFVETNANTVKNLGIEYGATDGTMAQFQGNSALVGLPLPINGQILPVPSFDYNTSPISNASVSPTSFFGGYSFGILSFNQLTAVLRAIETNGDGQYLSKPKVLTLNNKPAEVSITANTVVQFDVKQFTGSGYLGEQSKTPIRQVTGITLWVTPQVNDNGMITLIITPAISRPALSEFFPADKVVDTQKQAITTSVRVKDGSTVLIGGLLSNQKINTIRKVPLLGHLPLVGALFTSSQKSSTERELLVLITPRLVKDQ